MTQTLPNKRLREIAEDGFLEHGDAKTMAAELLAIRQTPKEIPKEIAAFIYEQCDGYVNVGADAQAIWKTCRAKVLAAAAEGPSKC
ncbi:MULTISPECIES: hypothetical protein [Serratia]|uniref:hypothetical protein n=1 Tax=Serratia TaxID=613 RepID=UPI000B5E7894|nr:hypothetical protein [Serratia marcescens]ASM06712.1 hypothetical protein BVG91_06550 [Serratia marcescens]MDX7543774.1 hypothetical protein [Serratia marcescens]MDX7565395.1 hypothetical protein [Serratia marcescens]